MSLKLPIFNNQPSIIKADFHVNTPMFASGSQQSEAELTPTAFKGVLRFWWRALNWSKIFLANNQDNQQALIALHKQESELFGLSASAGKEKDKKQERQQGQGKCLVNDLKFTSTKKWQYTGNRAGTNYLLGQGLYHFRNGLTRPALNHGQSFSIQLTVSAEYHEEIIDVLQVIGLLGGFGSRSRHGFGSVTLTDIGQKQIGKDNEFVSLNIEVSNAVETLKELLKEYNCRENTKLPPLSAFYAGTRIDVVAFNKPDALSLLNEVGEEIQMYRSWGRNGKVNGKDAERNFEQDHHMMRDYIDNGISDNPTHPDRVIFGLPHAYLYSDEEKIRVDAQLTIVNDSGESVTKKTRRSSPLLQHIHKTKDNRFQLIHCLLKSEFLPHKGDIVIRNKSANKKIDWTMITNFMNRDKFANKTTLS